MASIGWIVIGLLAGTVARSRLPPSSRENGGRAVTLILGVVGALLGGFVGSALFAVSIQEYFHPATWLLAVAGSTLVLGAHALATRAREGQ